MILDKHLYELKAEEAFTKQAPFFDKEYADNPIIQYKRKRVRTHAIKLLAEAGSILELNSGTGEDAIFFAGKGFQVHATDISVGMQNQLLQKTAKKNYSQLITTETCSFLELDQLKNKGPYDLIFSNFGGLNCTGELDIVLQSFAPLLKPGGKVCLVIITPFCIWETLYFLKGEFKTATRRFFSRYGRKATIDGSDFRCWYYSPKYVLKRLQSDFNVLKIEGLCVAVPPSYRDKFVKRYPGFYALLCRLEEKLKTRKPWRTLGDYFIISLQKR